MVRLRKLHSKNLKNNQIEVVGSNFLNALYHPDSQGYIPEYAAGFNEAGFNEFETNGQTLPLQFIDPGDITEINYSSTPSGYASMPPINVFQTPPTANDSLPYENYTISGLKNSRPNKIQSESSTMQNRNTTTNHRRGRKGAWVGKTQGLKTEVKNGKSVNQSGQNSTKIGPLKREVYEQNEIKPCLPASIWDEAGMMKSDVQKCSIADLKRKHANNGQTANKKRRKSGLTGSVRVTKDGFRDERYKISDPELKLSEARKYEQIPTNETTQIISPQENFSNQQVEIPFDKRFGDDIQNFENYQLVDQEIAGANLAGHEIHHYHVQSVDEYYMMVFQIVAKTAENGKKC